MLYAPPSHSDFLYPSHGLCWLWDPILIALHAIPDLVTFICYMIIPLIAFHIYLKGHLTTLASLYPKLWITGGAFVFFCGLSHFGSMLEIWFGGTIFYLTGINKVLTAIASIFFVTLFWRERRSMMIAAKILAMVNAIAAEEPNKPPAV